MKLFLFFMACVFAPFALGDQWSCSCTGCTWTAVNCNSADHTCVSENGTPAQDCQEGDTEYRCIAEDDECGRDEDDSDCSDYCTQYGCDGHTFTCTEENDNDNDCLHADSLVTYKGREFTLAQLLDGAEPECVIPHVVTQRGLAVQTSCGTVRATKSHLVLSTNGYVPVSSLKAGVDSLLAGEGKDTVCTVTAVTEEEHEQQYFGLNCLHAEVLVNGLQISTFGSYHTVPAWYMYVAGTLFGVRAASAVGDIVAQWFFSYMR